MSTTYVDLDPTVSHTLAKLTAAIDWDRLAEEYIDSPFESPAGWRRLATWTEYQAGLVYDRLGVFVSSFTDEPYRTEHEQHDDIVQGRYQVSSLHCEHPHWTPAQNVNFRIWHDIDGHEALRAPFDRFGEVLVFWRHANQVARELSLGSPADRQLCVDALFCESIYQLAYSVSTGTFGPQLCVRLGRYGRIVRDAIVHVFPELLELS